MKKDDNTWLNIAYVAFALVVGYVVTKAMGTLRIQMQWRSITSDVYEIATFVVSIAAAVGVTLYLRSNKARHDYFLASIGEIRKVTWPGFDDTKRMTMVVCVVVGVFSAILALFDFVWTQVLQIVLA